jgi:hypothetical protein
MVSWPDDGSSQGDPGHVVGRVSHCPVTDTRHLGEKCGLAAKPQVGFLRLRVKRARAAGPAQSSALYNFARSGPTKEALDGLSIGQADSYRAKGEAACGALIQPKE